jgi:ribosomal protein S18 acetylase RimI-like enzyme
MQIRRMEERDLEKVYEWGAGTEGFSANIYSRFWPEFALEKWVKKPDDVLLVAEEQDQMVGFILSQYHKESGKATIENIYIAEEHRGTGAGSRLLKKCIDQLKANGARHINACVKSDNEEAIKFFEKYGFNRGYDFVWMQIK